MWLLKDPINGKIKYLKHGITIKIGRRQSDIVLENDLSISRTHSSIDVTLKVKPTLAERMSICTVKDDNSKYGTHVTRNGVKMKVSNDGLELQPLDTLQFGLQQHIFKVEYIHIATVTSCLTKDHKEQLKGIGEKVGFLITNTFDDNCTHLTATTATSTTKIISALIAGIPVININFWLAVLTAVENNEKLPDPNDFILPLLDKGVNTQRVSLKPISARKSLFKGKKFIFFSKKVCEEYNKMISDAGGKVQLYSGSLQHIPEDFFDDNSIIMQITDESLTNDLIAFNTLVYNKMREKNLRMISETEIPLAIVYVSLDKYCNPKYHFKELIKRKTVKEDESKILALDTQDILMTASNNELDKNIEKVCLPETNDFMEENIPKEESHLLNNTSPQFDLENNSVKEYTVHRKNTDKIFSNKMVKIDTHPPTEKKETSESIKQTIESNDFDNSTNNRPNSNFRLKRQSNTTLESYVTKKRAKEKVSDNEMSKNIQSGWKTKKCSSSLEISKKQCPLTKSKNDFDELEQRRNEIKEKKQDKLSKWGFKKIAKKSINFDLDDFEEDEPKVEVRQKSDKSLNDSNRERKNALEETTQKSSKALESYQNNKSSKENMDKNWTAFKASKPRNDKSNLAMDKEACESNLVRLPVKMEEADNDIRKGNKTFKKVHSIIPIKRIALADMKAWTLNS